VLIILALCITPMYLNIMLSQVLVAAKRQVVWTWAMVAATVINPLLNLTLIPVFQHSHHHNGAIGAALSLLGTELVIVALGFALVGRAVIDRRLLARTARAAVASGAMWAAATVAGPLGVAPSLAVAVVAFLVPAAALGLVSRQELETGRRLVAARLPRARART
jgi:Na+-driven multidrug efflux pump